MEIYLQIAFSLDQKYVQNNYETDVLLEHLP